MTVDHEALREQYLAALDHEIASGRRRLAEARNRGAHEGGPTRAEAVVAIADVTLDWLEAERDRLRAGGAFDVDDARTFLERRALTDDS